LLTQRQGWPLVILLPVVGRLGREVGLALPRQAKEKLFLFLVQ